MLERRELGDAGLSYIRERLAGGRTLSRLLLEGLDLTAGHAWAYLPPEVTDERAIHFADPSPTRFAADTPPERVEGPGGLWEAVHNRVGPLITQQVLTFLGAEDHGVAVWEVPLSNARDPWVQNHPEEPLLFVGDEVYYMLRPDTVTSAAVAEGLSLMGAWWGSPAVLAALPAEALRPFLTPRASIAAQQLRPLVDHCRLLFFEAYDREGYVWWSPNGLADVGDFAATADPWLPHDRGP